MSTKQKLLGGGIKCAIDNGYVLFDTMTVDINSREVTLLYKGEKMIVYDTPFLSEDCILHLRDFEGKFPVEFEGG